MSRIASKSRFPLRLLAGAFGILLFAYLVYRAGPTKLVHSMAALGWGLCLVIAWGGVAHVVKTCAWRLTLLDEKYRVSFSRMLGLRLASEAVGQLGGLGQLFGDGLRISLLGPAMPLVNGIASVTLDRAFFVLSAAVVSIVGLLAVLTVLPLPHALMLYAGLFSIILLGVVLVPAVAVTRRRPVLSGAARMLGRIHYFSGWVERKRSLIHSVEDNLFNFYHHTPRSFWASFTLNLGCQVGAVFEVLLILWLMSDKITLFGALAIEALTKLVNIIGTFNPGNVGTYEGGNMLIVKIFGLSGATGLALAFVRRLRALFWSAVGVLCLVKLSKTTQQTNLIGSNDNIMRVESESMSTKSAPEMSESTGHTAVILANSLGSFGFGSPMPKVGALPILLRSILGADRAGATRVVITTDRWRGPRIQRDLRCTGRLPRNLEWCEFSSVETSLPALLRQIASDAKRLVLIAGDRTYHPSLLKRAFEVDAEDDSFVLVTGSGPVGICSLSKEVAIDVASCCRSVDSSFEQVHSCLTVTDFVRCESVSEDTWQRIRSEEERLSAEHKLDRWLVKPTDGIFARFNRRISIPISRQIIRIPVTPNMVSLFTLGVSLTAGILFGIGSYWFVLMGAILSWFASVLDGCDGEVARLKLQESAFGCWLETICDYLYYLFVFAGMTIGVVRATGNRSYLIWGAFLVVGAIASFLATGLQRHQLTSGRPEQYLGVWHRAADTQRSNPFLYLGRHTEFIIRRCFVPHVFLFCALFHIMNWLLVGATIGANLVWIIALYSHLTFARARGSTLPTSRQNSVYGLIT